MPSGIFQNFLTIRQFLMLDNFCCLHRFNLSFQVSTDDNEGSDADTDETGWPSFSSISKSSGFLDKELAASGFSRKDQEDIEKVW